MQEQQVEEVIQMLGEQHRAHPGSESQVIEAGAPVRDGQVCLAL